MTPKPQNEKFYNFKRQSTFGIRKWTVGVVSVSLGTAIVATAPTASADSLETAPTTEVIATATEIATADKTNLKLALDTAKALDFSNTDAALTQAFLEVFNTATTVVDNSEAAQTDIDSATDALNKAVNAIKEAAKTSSVEESKETPAVVQKQEEHASAANELTNTATAKYTPWSDTTEVNGQTAADAAVSIALQNGSVLDTQADSTGAYILTIPSVKNKSTLTITVTAADGQTRTDAVTVGLNSALPKQTNEGTKLEEGTGLKAGTGINRPANKIKVVSLTGITEATKEKIRSELKAANPGLLVDDYIYIYDDGATIIKSNSGEVIDNIAGRELLELGVIEKPNIVTPTQVVDLENNIKLTDADKALVKRVFLEANPGLEENPYVVSIVVGDQAIEKAEGFLLGWPEYAFVIVRFSDGVYNTYNINVKEKSNYSKTFPELNYPSHTFRVNQIYSLTDTEIKEILTTISETQTSIPKQYISEIRMSTKMLPTVKDGLLFLRDDVYIDVLYIDGSENTFSVPVETTPPLSTKYILVSPEDIIEVSSKGSFITTEDQNKVIDAVIKANPKLANNPEVAELSYRPDLIAKNSSYASTDQVLIFFTDGSFTGVTVKVAVKSQSANTSDLITYTYNPLKPTDKIQVSSKSLTDADKSNIANIIKNYNISRSNTYPTNTRVTVMDDGRVLFEYSDGSGDWMDVSDLLSTNVAPKLSIVDYTTTVGARSTNATIGTAADTDNNVASFTSSATTLGGLTVSTSTSGKTGTAVVNGTANKFGKFTTNLTATDAAGARGTGTATVTVQAVNATTTTKVANFNSFTAAEKSAIEAAVRSANGITGDTGYTVTVTPNGTANPTVNLTQTSTGYSNTVTATVVLRLMNEQYEPTSRVQTVNVGDTVNPELSINTTGLPSGTRYTWQTAPNTSTNGNGKTGTVRVTYPDNSYDDVAVTVNVRPQSEQYNPTAKANTVDRNATPVAQDSINTTGLPTGTTYTWATQPNTSTPGNKPGVVTVRYPDGSTDTVNVTVTVRPDADKYTPAAAPVSTKQGVVPEASEGIGNKAAMPTGTRYTWAVAPDVSTTGTKPATVRVTFPDGSTKDVPVTVTVTSSQTLAEQYQPIGQTITVSAGATVNPRELIKNAADMPTGTSYTFVTTPNLRKAGVTVPVQIKVTFSDGSSTLVAARIIVQGAMNQANTPVGLVPTNVTVGKTLTPQGLIKNVNNLPVGTTFSWSLRPDLSKKGVKTAKVLVTYPDQTTDEVIVRFTVK